MLDERKTAILGAVVQEYVSTAQPVGSSHVANSPGMTVSSATIRNDMATLEDDGFLMQPHPSAGRIPTDKGYRYFVDHLAAPGQLDESTAKSVGDFFSIAHSRLEEMLHHTSDLLTKLTNSAAVVLGPTTEAAIIRSAQIVRLAATAATVVLVFGNGSVGSEVIEFDPATTDDTLGAASCHLAGRLVGRTLSSVGTLAPSGNAGADGLCHAAILAMRQSSTEDHAFVGGVSAIAASFDAVDVVRRVIHTLEQQVVVVSLVRDVVERGMSIAIGAEHGVETLSACSVVVAPVVVDGERVGSVGVLGPTRMNYPRALATVEVVSARLARRLGDGV